MAKESTTISIDTDVKSRACTLFAELGLDMSTAVNIFLRQAVYERSIPFAIHRGILDKETRAALEEMDRRLAKQKLKEKMDALKAGTLHLEEHDLIED